VATAPVKERLIPANPLPTLLVDTIALAAAQLAA